MFKLLGLYKRFLSLEIQGQLIYQPVMALFSYIAHFAWVLFSYVFLVVIAATGLTDKTRLELLLFLSYFHAVKGLFWIYASRSSAFLAGSAFREGRIDFLLLKPINSQWLISSFRPNVFAVVDLFVGIGSFFYFLNRLGIFTVVNLTLFLISLVLSTLLLYSIWFSYLTFFVPSGEASAVHAVINLFWVFGEYPSNIYQGISKIATIVFPTVVITTLPMSYLLGQRDPAWLSALALASFVFLLASSSLWNHMLRSYTSAS